MTSSTSLVASHTAPLLSAALPRSLALCFYFLIILLLLLLFKFWLCWVFVAERGLLSLVAVCGLLLLWCLGFSCCRVQAQEWYAGELPCSMWDLSFPARNWACVPCIGRRILNHWTSGKPLICFYFFTWSVVDYNVVISAVQQSDSVTCIYPFLYSFLLFITRHWL